MLQIHVFTFYWVSWEWCSGGSAWELGLIKILDTYAHFKSMEANQSLISFIHFLCTYGALIYMVDTVLKFHEWANQVSRQSDGLGWENWKLKIQSYFDFCYKSAD